jgi:hypothetical protein
MAPITNPTPGDNWTEPAFEAVLALEPRLMPQFTAEVTERVWKALRAVLVHHGRDDVVCLVIEQAVPPVTAVGANWREQAAKARQQLTNQARRERAGEGNPSCEGLVFGSRAELAVYKALADLQRERPSQDAFVILPLPGARLRDAGVRYPDFAVIGNGRAVIVEVDGVHHYAKTRKADDQDRDRHWDRCGVHTIRIPSEHTSNLDSLKDRLREDLNRRLWIRQAER